MDCLLNKATGFGARSVARPIVQFPKSQLLVGDRSYLVLSQRLRRADLCRTDHFGCLHRSLRGVPMRQ